jgi:DNA-binding transcriptional regulator/RsmH inhibitor MraZ
MLHYFLSILSIVLTTFCFAQKEVYHEGLTSFKVTKNTSFVYGFKNTKDKVVISPSYDSIVAPFRFGRAIVIINNQYGTIDKKGKTIIPFEYRNILPEQHGLTPVKNKNGLWGFFSYKGIITIPCEYNNFKFVNKGKYIIVQKNGKWGMINLSNKTLLSFEYKAIEAIGSKQYRLLHYNKWEHITQTGKSLNTFEYDSVHFTSFYLFTYKLNGWEGLLSSDGSILIRNEFEEIKEFNNDLVSLKQHGLWGVKKQRTEEWVLNPVNDIIRIDSLLIYAGTTFGNSDLIHWNMYNHSGTKLNTETIIDYGIISNGMMAVKGTNKRWGFINDKGKTLIPTIYSMVGNFKNGLCHAEMNDEKFIINKNGDVVLRGQDVYLYDLGLLKLDAFQNKKYIYHPDTYTELIPVDSVFIKVRQNGKYGLITTTGETILPSIYSEIKTGDSKTTFSVVLNNQLKIIQAGVGSFPVDKKIKSIEGFYNEFAVFLYSNGEYGFVDDQGRIRIAPQYKKVQPFQNEVAIVQLNGKWGIINKNESLLAQPYYDKISTFINSVCIVKENELYYLMDINGRILTPEGYESIQPTVYGNYRLTKNNLSGLANKYGKEIISPRYQSIQEFSGNLFKVKADNLYGVIDVNQKIVLHFKYQEIFYHAGTDTFLTCEEGLSTLIKVE